MRKLFRFGSRTGAEPESAPSPTAPQAPTVRHTYGGLDLEVSMADDVSVAWYDVDWPEVPEVDFLSRHGLNEGALVFDLGAHQCVYAMLLGNIVGSAGKVVAVEASPHNADVARENLRLNQVANVEVLHSAVTETGGTVNFGRGFNGQVGDFPDSVTVTGVTIDGLSQIYGSPDLLFIDIEGFEVRALHGATATLATRPLCFIEVHVDYGLEEVGDSSDALLEFFPKDDYELFLSNEVERHPTPYSDADYGVISKERYFLTAIPRVQ